MFSSLSTFQSLIDFHSGTSAPSGPTQSYGGAFNRSIIHTAPLSTRYLSVNTAQYIGGGKFTIEFWVFIPSNTTTAGVGLFGNRYQSNTTNPRLHCWFNFGGNNGAIRLFNIAVPSANDNQFLITNVIQLGQWNHIAFTRDANNVCRSFVNGVLQPITRTWTTSFTFDNQWAIGRAYQDLNQEHLVANGLITGFSFSNECYYTTTFTPTKQFLNNDSTKILLLNFNGGTLTDSSSSNNTVTNNGSMGFSTTVPT
jgi:hypothetical protein